MASLASVRQAAQACLELGRPVDVLLNNAGIVNTSRRTTVGGFEETLAVNHFAPFLLIGLLLPTMLEVPGARIVNVASAAHASGGGDPVPLAESQRHTLEAIHEI